MSGKRRVDSFVSQAARKGRWLNLLLVVFSGALTLVFSDILAAWWFQVPSDYLKRVVRMDPTLSPPKRLKPDLDVVLTGAYREFRFRLTTDGEGFRRSSRPERAAHGKEEIIFLGDSQTVGVGVGDGETYPALVAERLGLSTLNTACYGYNNIEEFELLRQVLKARSPRLVVLGFFAGNDPYENGVHERNQAGKARGEHGTVVGKLKNYFAKHSFFYNSLARLRRYEVFNRLLYRIGSLNPKPPLELAVYGKDAHPKAALFWEATERAIIKMKEETRLHGTRFVFLFLPDRFQVDDAYWRGWVQKYRLDEEKFDRVLPNRRLQDFCRREGIPFLDVTPPLREREKEGHRVYWVVDNHFSPEGNRTLAAALADFLRPWVS